MSFEALHLIEQISREKNIDKNILIEALKSAVEAAAHKRLPQVKNLHCLFNETSGVVDIYIDKTVVDTVKNPDNEITLKEALKKTPDARVGETVVAPVAIENYGRIAAQMAKQVILQKVREAEIDNIFNEFKDKKGDLVNGIAQRFEHGELIVDLGKAEGVLPRREQVFRETFNRGDRVRAYVMDVRKTPKSALVILSRTHTGLIKRLFEMEVPEISEGMVEIVGIAREPSGRTKIAVKTNDRDIDAVGACVGMRGMRVQSIVQELRGEKIDIVEYSDNPQEFTRNALSPAKISRIIVNEAERSMTLIVADDQMSLAIGKKGQNVRLAAKLVKWKIDIKGESDAPSPAQQALGLQRKAASPETHFLDLVKITKGLGEKMVPILFSNSIMTAQDVIKKGIEGLTKFENIGSKKAEALLSLAQSQLESIAAAEDKKNQEEAIVAEETSAETAEQTTDTAEEQEYPLEELESINSKTIKLLKKNGFQTIAELSITTLDDLIAIKGISEETANAVLEQTKLYMEKHENT